MHEECSGRHDFVTLRDDEDDTLLSLQSRVQGACQKIASLEATAEFYKSCLVELGDAAGGVKNDETSQVMAVAKQVDGWPDVYLSDSPGSRNKIGRIPNGTVVTVLESSRPEDVLVQLKCGKRGWVKKANLKARG